MTKAGVECDDIRLKRLVAMIAQKFVTDIANDAMHYNRQRLAQGGAGAASAGKAGGGPPGSKKAALTMEDLQAALADHGINIKRPSYFT
jgi:transcription initiation factor TFIID subunit 10